MQMFLGNPSKPLAILLTTHSRRHKGSVEFMLECSVVMEGCPVTRKCMLLFCCLVSIVGVLLWHAVSCTCSAVMWFCEWVSEWVTNAV